jgi:hypothetical protein
MLNSSVPLLFSIATSSGSKSKCIMLVASISIEADDDSRELVDGLVVESLETLVPDPDEELLMV